MDARVRFDEVVAGVVVRVLREDGGADGGLRPVALEGGEGVGGDGVQLKAEVVQARVWRGFAQEGVGGVDEVEAGAVADFADGEVAGARDALVQAVAVDENVLAFGKASAGVVVDVLVVVAARLAVGVKGEAGGLEEHGAGFYVWERGAVTLQRSCGFVVVRRGAPMVSVLLGDALLIFRQSSAGCVVPGD